jgi:hypothetical protein
MKTKGILKDKTKVFLGLQTEILTTIKDSSFDLRFHLDQAAKDLETYFENRDIIPIALGAGGLRYEYAFLRENQHKTWIEQSVRLMLTEFRQARLANENACLLIWGKAMEKVDRAISNVAGVTALQANIEELSPELSTKSILRDVGDLLEGSLQPLARLRLDMQGIAGMRAPSLSPTEKMSFGKVIEELASRPIGGDIYSPEPFNLKVSQWRNIANHNSYRFENETVVCMYGKPENPQEIRCSVEDIISIGIYMNALYYAHKIAFEIFSIDNREQLTSYMSKIQITEHTKDGALAYGLVASGFEIVKVGQKPGVWMFGLNDRFSRAESDIRTALQAAVTTYLLLSEPFVMIAYVNSGHSIFHFSFKIDVSTNEDEFSLMRDVDIMLLDKYWRPIRRKKPFEK